MPRETKLTRELIDKMAKLFELGCAVTAVHDACCVSSAAYYSWIRISEKAVIKRDIGEELTKMETLCIELEERTNQSKAKFQEECLLHIQAAAPKTWQAAAWLLERRNPREFSLYAHNKIRHEGEIKIKFEEIKPALKKKEVKSKPRRKSVVKKADLDRIERELAEERKAS